MISAEELEKTIYKWCELKNISPEKFMQLLGAVIHDNVDNADNITISKIVELIEEKIEKQGEQQ